MADVYELRRLAFEERHFNEILNCWVTGGMCEGDFEGLAEADVEHIKNQADKVTTLSECGLKGLPLRLAIGSANYRGYYTYTDATSGQKVFVHKS